MGTKQTVELPSKTFSSKAEARSFFSDMLNRYKDGDQISPDDGVLLFEFLQRHPEAEEKIGNGVDLFFRKRSPDHGTSGFHVLRQDGTATDFSLKQCLTGKKPTVDDYFYRACRTAVSPYLIGMKNDIFRGELVTCKRSGVRLTEANSNLRHTIPKFIKIVEDFKSKYNITANMNMMRESADMQYSVCFSDLCIEKKFVEFHRSCANLEIYLA